jgi:hypothetical protein
VTAGHARRARTSAAGALRSSRAWLALLAVPLIAAIPAAAFFFGPIQADEIAEIVRDAGFDPVVPPNRLRGPGALYVVDEDGTYEVVCDADPALIDGVIRRSPTENSFRTRLENGRFSLAGEVAEMLQARFGGSGLRSIELRLTDVGISEITHSNLWRIQNSLLHDPSCDEVVHGLLRANKKVCQGYSALSATTIYRISTDSQLDSEALTVVNAVQQEIANNAQSEISRRSENELTGENLFYGIRLSSLCVVPRDATVPSILPQPTAAAPVAGAAG